MLFSSHSWIILNKVAYNSRITSEYNFSFWTKKPASDLAAPALNIGRGVLADDASLTSVTLRLNRDNLLGEEIGKVDNDGVAGRRVRDLAERAEGMRHLIAKSEVRVEDLDVALGVSPGAQILIPGAINPGKR